MVFVVSLSLRPRVRFPDVSIQNNISLLSRGLNVCHIVAVVFDFDNINALITYFMIRATYATFFKIYLFILKQLKHCNVKSKAVQFKVTV